MKKICIAPALALILFLSACPNPSGSDDGSPETSVRSILGALGVSEIDSLPDLTTTSVSGTAVAIDDPDSWQPLKKGYSVFSPKSEVLQIGMTDGSYAQSVFQDSSSSYSASHPLPTGNSWASANAKMSAKADLDGDGIDEVVVFYTPVEDGTTLNMVVYRDGAYSSAKTLSDIDATSKANEIATQGITVGLASAENYHRYWALSSADVDGDGIDEILFTNYYNARVMKIAADGKSYSVVERKTFDSANAITDFKGGDIDGDGEAELIVCFEDKGFALYDSSFDSPLLIPEYHDPSSGYSGTYTYYEAAFGDFDGDGIDELCVAATGTSGVLALSYDYAAGTLTKKADKQLTAASILPSGIEYFRLFPAALDFDALSNGKDELSLGTSLFKNVTTSFDTVDAHSIAAAALTGKEVGDVDGDAKEDVVYSYARLSGLFYYNQIQAVGIAAYQDWDVEETKNAYLDSAAADFIASYDAENNICRTTVSAGNFDKDSNRVKYVGHTVEFTNPIVIAVLASPPYYSDIAEAAEGYNYTNWETTFGRIAGSSASDATKVGFSVGTTIELETGIDIFGVEIASFKASSSFSKSKSWEWTTGSSVTKTVTYAATGGEDRVIFTSVPLDRYAYEVLESSDPADVGTKMYINLPRDYSTYSVTRSFFNERNGELPDVAVLTHAIGAPSTYPTETQKDSLLATYSGYEIGPEQAAQGESEAGCTSLEIVVESTNEKTYSVDISTEYSAGGGAAGVTVSRDLGFSTGYSYTASTTTGNSFGGTVGFLPTSYYSQSSYAYGSGLFVFPYEDEESAQTYWVIDYWVE